MSAEASVGSHAADSAQSAVSQPACQNTDDLRNRGLLGSKYVKLNVGGSLHYTTVQTLSKEDSLLQSICNGSTEVTTDSEGKWTCLSGENSPFYCIRFVIVFVFLMAVSLISEIVHVTLSVTSLTRIFL